ncbi:probable histone-lysine N-methyltransferase PRDM7 isoform X2 [Strongylocentrotus purpuratus]|uniref:C2H2-type domain-containing protein n=1 Tax=Strongylocentrotus purpuratus TaxID=7668 RepID=A0A7M7PF30_STRPU|nr:probable histone-lysine N-methyltransferase PRDM7 isoform X2 [Strongylocentrotus purpuratus]
MPLPANDDYSAVQAYFTAKEWAETSDYEKLRLKNIKENYEMLLEVGLQVDSPPDFMRPRRGRKKQIVEESDSKDEEWKQKKAKKKSIGIQVSPSEFMRPRHGRKKQIVEESDSENEECKQKKAKKRSRDRRKEKPQPATRQSRYPKRAVSRKSYNKEHVPDDSGVYRCEYCGSLYAIPLVLAKHLKYKHGHYGIVPPAGAPKKDILQFIKGEIRSTKKNMYVITVARHLIKLVISQNINVSILVRNPISAINVVLRH